MSWQSFVATALQSPESFAADEAMTAAAARLATGNDRLSPVEQLDIYREQYFFRHVASLEEDFATIFRLLGNEGFWKLATTYLVKHPSKSYSLRDLGDKMARFLTENEPYKSDPLLADLARTEWAFIEAFDAPDAAPLDVTKLATASEDDWGRARITLHPSVQRLRLAYPAHLYRAQVKAGETAERPAPSDTCLVVYRGPELLHYIAIEPRAFALLEALVSGEPLAAACERVARDSGVSDAAEMETQVGAWFQNWAAYGWIADVTF